MSYRDNPVYLEDAIADVIHVMDQTVVAEVRGRQVLRGDLRKAFEAVQDPANWKNPIDKLVDAESFDADVTRAAVEFFTGGTAEIFPMPGGGFRVMAAGYYHYCGA